MELRTEQVRLFGATAGRVAKLLSSAFPPSEQLPFPLLVLLAQRDGVDFLALYDGEAFCGFAYLIARGEVTYVLFLAMAGEHRSKGYGGAMLEIVKRAHPGNAVVLDIESPSEPSANREQRVRRREFYVRNGFRELGVSMLDNGCVYDLLVCGRDVSEEEVSALLGWFSLGATRPRLFR